MARTLFTSESGGDLKLPSNRELLRTKLSLNVLHFMNQSHSDIVMVADGTKKEFNCDALVTTAKGVGLAALAADCMPITFAAEGLIGIAHIGRVGFTKGIATKVIKVMKELGAGEISATIGPSICGKCYEVSPEMYHEIITLFPATTTSDVKHSLDLQSGVSFELKSLGVSVRNLSACTLENSRYFSFRRGAVSARQAGVISL